MPPCCPPGGFLVPGDSCRISRPSEVTQGRFQLDPQAVDLLAGQARGLVDLAPDVLGHCRIIEFRCGSGGHAAPPNGCIAASTSLRSRRNILLLPMR